MEGEVGAVEVDVRPDQLDRFVLRHAALAAVEQEGEERLRLAGAGLLAAPLADELPVAFRAQRAERVYMEAGWTEPFPRVRRPGPRAGGGRWWTPPPGRGSAARGRGPARPGACRAPGLPPGMAVAISRTSRSREVKGKPGLLGAERDRPVGRPAPLERQLERVGLVDGPARGEHRAARLARPRLRSMPSRARQPAEGRLDRVLGPSRRRGRPRRGRGACGRTTGRRRPSSATVARAPTPARRRPPWPPTPGRSRSAASIASARRTTPSRPRSDADVQGDPHARRAARGGMRARRSRAQRRCPARRRRTRPAPRRA